MWFFESLPQSKWISLYALPVPICQSGAQSPCVHPITDEKKKPQHLLVTQQLATYSAALDFIQKFQYTDELSTWLFRKFTRLAEARGPRQACSCFCGLPSSPDSYSARRAASERTGPFSDSIGLVFRPYIQCHLQPSYLVPLWVESQYIMIMTSRISTGMWHTISYIDLSSIYSISVFGQQ
jgi:hypothetical protein